MITKTIMLPADIQVDEALNIGILPSGQVVKFCNDADYTPIDARSAAIEYVSMGARIPDEFGVIRDAIKAIL